MLRVRPKLAPFPGQPTRTSTPTPTESPPPMTTERKVRGDAKLERLAPEQKERLLIWLDEENRTYAEVVDLVRTEFGLSVGKTAVGHYWQRHAMPRRYAATAEASAAIAELPEANFSDTALKLVRMHACAALMAPEPQLATAARLLETVRAADRLALAQQRVALEERRVALKERSSHRGFRVEDYAPPPYDPNIAPVPPSASDFSDHPPLPLPSNPPIPPRYSAPPRPYTPGFSSPPSESLP